MYEIERVPDDVLTNLQRTDRKGVKQYPFAEMQVGDSFTVDQGLPAGRAKSAMRAYANRNDMRFSAMRDGNKVRIVRIA